MKKLNFSGWTINAAMGLLMLALAIVTLQPPALY